MDNSPISTSDMPQWRGPFAPRLRALACLLLAAGVWAVLASYVRLPQQASGKGLWFHAAYDHFEPASDGDDPFWLTSSEGQEWSEETERQLRQGNPEWSLLFRLFHVLAEANVRLEGDVGRGSEQPLEAVDHVIDDTLRLEREQGQQHFMLSYGRGDIQPTPEGQLRVRVRNAGEFAGRRSGGEGLRLIEQRLMHAYGARASFEIRGVEQHTVAELRLPLSESAHG